MNKSIFKYFHFQSSKREKNIRHSMNFNPLHPKIKESVLTVDNNLHCSSSWQWSIGSSLSCSSTCVLSVVSSVQVRDWQLMSTRPGHWLMCPVVACRCRVAVSCTVHSQRVSFYLGDTTGWGGAYSGRVWKRHIKFERKTTYNNKIQIQK